MGYCCLSPERGELTLNSKRETNDRVKMGQGSKCAVVVYPLKESNNSEQQERNKWQGQNGARVKIGCCCLPPERVELKMNSKKETKARSKWASSQDGLLWLRFKPGQRSQLGPGSSWARPILTRS